MIVLIGGEKGGTGKTTLATNLAQMRAARGHDAVSYTHLDVYKRQTKPFLPAHGMQNGLLANAPKAGQTKRG